MSCTTCLVCPRNQIYSIHHDLHCTSKSLLWQQLKPCICWCKHLGTKQSVLSHKDWWSSLYSLWLDCHCRWNWLEGDCNWHHWSTGKWSQWYASYGSSSGMFRHIKHESDWSYMSLWQKRRLTTTTQKFAKDHFSIKVIFANFDWYGYFIVVIRVHHLHAYWCRCSALHCVSVCLSVLGAWVSPAKSQKRLNWLKHLGADRVSPRNHVLDRGPDVA